MCYTKEYTIFTQAQDEAFFPPLNVGGGSCLGFEYKAEGQAVTAAPTLALTQA